jgi:hypothetical protein
MTFLPNQLGIKSTVNSSTTNLNGTTLNGAIDSSQTSIILTSVSDFPASGAVMIGTELISYTAITGNTLTDCTRGAYVTTAASASSGAGVGEVFIGTGEENAYPALGVMHKMDQSGVMKFQFSGDGTNWDSTFPTAGFDINGNFGGIPEFHTAVKLGRYFRILVGHNGTTATTTFRLNTYYGEFNQGNLPLNQDIGADADSTVVRAVNVGADPSGAYVNTKQDGSAFRTTSNLGGTLINNIGGYDTTVTDSFTVDSTSDFADSGYIYIGSEFISYASKTATTFDTLTRGQFGSTAATITDNDIVGEVYTTGILTLNGYTEVATKILCSNTGRMRFQWYADETGSDNIRTLAPPYLNVNTYDYLGAPNFGPYVRYTFANTSSDKTTDFYFETEFYTKAISAQVLTLDSTLVGGMTSNVTRSILVGQQEGGTTYQNVSTTNQNELLTNTLASNRAARSLYTTGTITADKYIILVDLDDTTNYPHNSGTSCLNIDSFSLSINFSTNTAEANVKVGVITRIDGTNADISYLISETSSVQSANESITVFQNFQPSAVKFEVSGGAIVGGVTNDKDTNNNSVNTGLSLDSPTGNVTPAVGDIIVFFDYIADNYNAVVSILYHSC